MSLPPQEELLALHQAASGGDVQIVEEEVMRLQQLNPDYTAFVTRIQELAAEFEYEKIVQIIDQERMR
ncbi:MAG TPA: hybrid sensor histidine kinase/response regulator, partial [Cyanobacteria bacterium UBA8543]|nr:hybrid sensor histidine kinase/response regulator [Cyanobacteria bacterium UBA8543]